MPAPVTITTPSGRTFALVDARALLRPDADTLVPALVELLQHPASRDALTALANVSAQDDDLAAIAQHVAAMITRGELVAVDAEGDRLTSLLPTSAVTDEPWDDIPRLVDLVPKVPPPHTSWLTLDVRREDGYGFPDATFRIELSDGSRRSERLDANSRWSCRDLGSAMSARIVFDPPLDTRDAAQPSAAAPSDALVTFELPDYAELPSTALDRGLRITVPLPGVHIAQLEALHFGNARAIVLPTPDMAGAGSSPLEMIASALAFTATRRGASVCVVGHTDMAGNDASNVELSAARARNVALLLANDGAAWAEHALGHHAVEDLQHIYRWAAARQLWPCDPGPADNVLGPATLAARRAFREAYNREMAGSVPLDADIGVADWAAIFELYVQELGLMLTAVGDFATLSRAVQLADPATIGCGSLWTRASVTAKGYASATDRRVDIVVLPEPAAFDLTRDPLGIDLYGNPGCRVVAIPDLAISRLVRVQLRDARGRPAPELDYDLTGIAGAHAGKTDAFGFTESFVARIGERAFVQAGETRYRIEIGNAPAEGLAFAQSVLNALGYYAGETTGSMNRPTRAALRNYQWIEGLPITGALDDDTLARLRAASWR